MATPLNSSTCIGDRSVIVTCLIRSVIEMLDGIPPDEEFCADLAVRCLRNALSNARGQWPFWMDSDDTINEKNGRQLRELAYGPHEPNVLGYVMQVRCPAHDASFPEEATVVDHLRMFHNDP